VATAEDHLLIELDRSNGEGVRVQLERALRTAIREERLHPDTRLPSSRALSQRLDVSRGVVVEAYAQLTAEGYLRSRQGSGTRVAPGSREPAPDGAPAPLERAPRYDFSLGVPDLAAFPRAAWGASMRRVLREAPDALLGHPDPRGAAALRGALAAYAGRVRGVVSAPGRVLVCTGFAQGLGLAARALRFDGVRRVAMEDPGFVLHRWMLEGAGLEVIPVPVDDRGLRVDALAASDAEAVLVAPARQAITGVVLAPERRTELVAWATSTGGMVIEDDYDAEYRYDREPVGALQGLAPEHVVYGGSASKTLAPALRLGWLVLPERLGDRVAFEKLLCDAGSPTLEQLALADLIERGEHDRHLRRMRLVYRRRRDAFAAAVGEHLPGARVGGVAAGLHAVVELPAGTDEGALVAAARERKVAIEPVFPHRATATADVQPAVLAGYAALPEAAITEGVRRIGGALEALV
jgi:GntR family transcriptional regulator/MocR family aminotransferase